jgi:hypothetical protein
MAADVVDGVDGAVLVADDEDGIGVDVEGEVVAGRWDLAGVAGEEPAFAPDGFEVVAIDLRIGIEGAEEAEVGWLAVEEVLNDRWSSGRGIDCGTDHARWMINLVRVSSRAHRVVMPRRRRKLFCEGAGCRAA